MPSESASSHSHHAASGDAGRADDDGAAAVSYQKDSGASASGAEPKTIRDDPKPATGDRDS